MIKIHKKACFLLVLFVNMQTILYAGMGSSVLGFCRKYPACTTLMGVNALTFALQKSCYKHAGSSMADFESRFIMDNDAVKKRGQWWRVGTGVFLHFTPLHLALNNFHLFLGREAERSFGSGKYLGIYMLSGIMGNLTTLFCGRPSVLGAAGALYGVDGAYYARAIKQKVVTPLYVVGQLACKLVLSRFMLRQPNYVSRISGFVTGYLGWNLVS